MAGEIPIGRWKLDLETFQAFRDDRPKEEKWELIAGSPVMMPPPSLDHQKISGVIFELLNNHLAKSKPEWEASIEIGLLVPEDDTFNPEPDVTVIDADTEPGQLYATRFYFVVEVLSSNDKPAVLASKLKYYQAHPSCLGAMFVRQDSIGAELYLREQKWQITELLWADDPINIPSIGALGPLGELYRRTRLYPGKSPSK